MPDSIARYYNEKANPNGDMLPGVPLADITQEQYDALPHYLKAAVDASPFYRKSAPPKAHTAEKD